MSEPRMENKDLEYVSLIWDLLDRKKFKTITINTHNILQHGRTFKSVFLS